MPSHPADSPATPPELVRYLQEPANTAALALPGWSRLIADARGANLLGALAARLNPASPPPPAAARRHLDAMRQLSERQRESVIWETHEIARALQPLGIPVVLLKGAAYVMADHPVSRGRLFGDIDLLVPRASLGRVELHLMAAGWTGAAYDPYDQRYYRQWMHELPPIVHVRRGTVIDVHHALLPLTGLHHPNPQRILDHARPLPGLPPIHLPQAEHLLIHSITHLVHESELHNGLRDLFDIDTLVRTDGAMPDYWEHVTHESVALDVAGPVMLGLTLAQTLLGTPIPAQVMNTLASHADNAIAMRLLTRLYRAALQPENHVATSPIARLARSVLYLRGHWLRMPPHLLARHLARKGWMRLAKKEPALEGRV